MSKPALLNVAILAAKVGAAELEFAVKKVHKLDVIKKGPTDYVTEVDKKVESIVFEEIKKYYPEDNFLGEESGHEVNTSNTTWILDPIDGTTNFIHGYPQYCISLACVVGDQTQHAVIIDPTRREEFSASRGKGAELNGERIRVSKRSSLSPCETCQPCVTDWVSPVAGSKRSSKAGYEKPRSTVIGFTWRRELPARRASVYCVTFRKVHRIRKTDCSDRGSRESSHETVQSLSAARGMEVTP